MLSITSWETMNLVTIPFIILIILASLRADLLEKTK
jgi:hypothetical protein